MNRGWNSVSSQLDAIDDPKKSHDFIAQSVILIFYYHIYRNVIIRIFIIINIKSFISYCDFFLFNSYFRK